MSRKPAHTERYGTAGYLAEGHPDDDHVIVKPLWVDVMFCRLCGAIVHDIAKHDTWHAEVLETLREQARELWGKG